MTSPFRTEGELHEWLRTALAGCDGLAELIENAEELSGFVPKAEVARQIHESFSYALESLHITEVISDNENISLSDDDILKPDFLLYAPETESVVIVELKNIPGPTRQAGTEASAYAAEVKTYLHFLADGDLVNVIVSPVWPALLEHYIVHEICWTRRKIICLDVYEKDGRPHLRIRDIDSLSRTSIQLKLGEHQIGGYQLCLYDDNLYSNPDNRTRLDAHFAQMKTAMSALAAKGNALGNHGFAFLWKDNWKESLAPYSITIGNVAAFPGLERFLFDLEEGQELSEMQQRFIKLAAEFVPEGHGRSLQEMVEYASGFLSRVCSPRMEGFTTWGSLRAIMVSRATLLAFAGWGAFGELHFQRLREEYAAGNTVLVYDDPDMGLKLVDDMVDLNPQRIDLSYFLEPDDDEEL